jgi:hypothetical protein
MSLNISIKELKKRKDQTLKNINKSKEKEFEAIEDVEIF